MVSCFIGELNGIVGVLIQQELWIVVLFMQGNDGEGYDSDVLGYTTVNLQAETVNGSFV